MSTSLLQIENLRTWIDAGDTTVRAVDGLSLNIEKGETFALLGESGCGKSVTALSVMRLLPDQGRIVEGAVRLEGLDLLQLSEAEMRGVRGARIGMIFQEPMLSLNPVMTVGAQIAEVLERHIDARGAEAERRARELLDAVRVPDAARRLGEYPFQLSGGLRQRVMIAMALACEPELLIADEPTTALDVTIQAQVLELLRELQVSRGMAMLLITHDLGVVAEMADRVAVMYAGRVVEEAPVAELFSAPAHPYTRGLLASIPGGAPGTPLTAISGTVPAPGSLPPGCCFTPRCPSRFEPCPVAHPGTTDLGGRTVKCYLHGPAMESAARA
jgi:peptide/nickel transport system ATP-binding protein